MGRLWRPWLGSVLTVCVVLAALLGVWLAGQPPVSAESPVPTPLSSEVVSPIPPTAAASSRLTSSWANAGTALLWTAVGVALGLGMILLTHAWYRRHSR